VPKVPSNFRLRDVAELRELAATNGAIVRSVAGGFVQVIHRERLTSEAVRANAIVSLDFRPGSFVGKGEFIARALTAQCVEAVGPAVIEAVQLGRHRNLD
jgi:uncharacterized membrane protein